MLYYSDIVIQKLFIGTEAMQIIPKINKDLYHKVKKIKLLYGYSDSERTLIIVHIGKCGGSTVRTALKDSSFRKSFKNVHSVHTSQPPILQKSKYLILIRNPISRAISAFNYRHQIVIKENKGSRFFNERKALLKYSSFNHLAENLYSDNELNMQAAQDYMSIHHLHEGISFYLSELLRSIRKEQIIGVIATEALDEDLKNLCGLGGVHKLNQGKSKKSLTLSKLARKNLHKFLYDDYQCIEKLLELNGTTTALKTDLLF